MLEAIFAAQRLDRLAHALHHRHQAEGADMGVRLGQDLRGGAGPHELGQHLAAEMARVLDLAVELAVGKGACPALAELHVGFRVELAPPPQAPGVPGALADQLAALQDDRAEPHLREDQPGEQAARPRPDHDRARACAIRGRPGHGSIAGVGRRLR